MRNFVDQCLGKITDLKIDAQQRQLRLQNPQSELLALTMEGEHTCSQIKNDTVLGEYFTRNNPWANRPWRKFNYWNGWYSLARERKPTHILEIGLGFGFSTIALARGAGESLQLLVSLDLGNFGSLFTKSGYPEMDNLRYVNKGISRYKKEHNSNFDYLQFAVNTQPPPFTDDVGSHVQCPHWQDDKELSGLLGEVSFDIILIDGRHTGDGLYNDLNSFFGYGNGDCLIICDDIQDMNVASSFSRFVSEKKQSIRDYCVWRYLHCDAKHAGSFRRDQGLILKGKE